MALLNARCAKDRGCFSVWLSPTEPLLSRIFILVIFHRLHADTDFIYFSILFRRRARFTALYGNSPSRTRLLGRKRNFIFIQIPLFSIKLFTWLYINAILTQANWNKVPHLTLNYYSSEVHFSCSIKRDRL